MAAPGLFAGHQNRFPGFQAIINFQLIEQWLNRNFTAADPGIKTCQHAFGKHTHLIESRFPSPRTI